MAERRPLPTRLTRAQKRHLRELYGDGKRQFHWRPVNGGESNCALVLRRKGLIEGSYMSYSDGYRLTPEGVAVVRGLIEADRV